jgi:hypothetical protein
MQTLQQVLQGIDADEAIDQTPEQQALIKKLEELDKKILRQNNARSI